MCWHENKIRKWCIKQYIVYILRQDIERKVVTGKHEDHHEIDKPRRPDFVAPEGYHRNTKGKKKRETYTYE